MIPGPPDESPGTTGQAVVIDTNVFVAAAFHPRSASLEILERIRQGRLQMIWNRPTRRETRRILERIPRLSWEAFSELFRPECEFVGQTRPQDFTCVADPDDRKFAALAEASGATLVTQDQHLLTTGHRAGVRVVRPGEYLEMDDRE